LLSLWILFCRCAKLFLQTNSQHLPLSVQYKHNLVKPIYVPSTTWSLFSWNSTTCLTLDSQITLLNYLWATYVALHFQVTNQLFKREDFVVFLCIWPFFFFLRFMLLAGDKIKDAMLHSHYKSRLTPIIPSVHASSLIMLLLLGFLLWKLLDLQHQHNKCTTLPHIRVRSNVWGPPSCEGVLCTCCDGVVQESNPKK
jgi:hypothetical protein